MSGKIIWPLALFRDLGPRNLFSWSSVLMKLSWSMMRSLRLFAFGHERIPRKRICSDAFD
jgi:hypothetical protein